MPRKTKKTSTAKPAVTECDCALAVLSTLGALCGVAVLALLAKACFFTPSIPSYGECYEHREDSTLARVTNVGYERGEYTSVSYDIIEYGFMRNTKSERERSVGTFNELYKKLDNCDSFTVAKQRITIQNLEDEIHDLRMSILRRLEEKRRK